MSIHPSAASGAYALTLQSIVAADGNAAPIALAASSGRVDVQ
jgi:hypothetical protein